MLASRPMVTSRLLVQEHRGDARPVLDEVLHPDVHVDGLLAPTEAAALDGEALRQRPPLPMRRPDYARWPA